MTWMIPGSYQYSKVFMQDAAQNSATISNPSGYALHHLTVYGVGDTLLPYLGSISDITIIPEGGGLMNVQIDFNMITLGGAGRKTCFDHQQLQFLLRPSCLQMVNRLSTAHLPLAII